MKAQMMNSKYFAWTNYGPQIWHELLIDTKGKPQAHIFLKKLEPDEEKLSLDELAEKYKDRKEQTYASNDK